MKKLALLLIPLMLIGIASATTTMYIGDSVTVSGSNLKVITIYEDCSALIQVDNYPAKAVGPHGKQVGPLWVKVKEDCFYAGESSFVYVDAEFNEVQANCETNADCDDNDPCTLDFCTGSPKRCDYESSHFGIIKCIDDDSCCPTDCTWKTDNDCETKECEDDLDCDDNFRGTTEECVDNICEYTEIGCKTGDRYCPNNCFYTKSLDPRRDNDCSEMSRCINHSQCNDKQPFKIGICFASPSTEPKYCNYTINESYVAEDTDPECGDGICNGDETVANCPQDCEYETVEHPATTCHILGERSDAVFNEPAYCSETGWQLQKPNNTKCKENYECLTNFCHEEVCAEPELSALEKIKSKTSGLEMKKILYLGLIAFAVVIYILIVRKMSKRE